MFFRVLPLLVAVACQAPDAETSLTDVEMLLDNHEGFPERARPLPDAQAHFRGGPDFDKGDAFVHDAFTVAEIDEEIAVIYEDGSVDLVLWLDRTELAPAVVDPLWSHGDVGVLLDAGPIEWVDVQGTAAHVREQTEHLDIDTWIDADAIDVFWVEQPRPLFEIESSAHTIPTGTVLYDRLDGESIAVLRHGQHAATSPDLPVQVVQTWQGWTRVRADRGTPFDAWVETENVHNANLGLYAVGHGVAGCGGAWTSSQSPTVLSGTLLRDGIDGAIVGRTTQDQQWELQEEPNDWTSALLWTPFGEAEVFIDPADLP